VSEQPADDQDGAFAGVDSDAPGGARLPLRGEGEHDAGESDDEPSSGQGRHPGVCRLPVE
jgi:hypothetical protein